MRRYFSCTRPPSVVATRDASLWPFSDMSPFNRPIGDAAVFVDHPVVRSRGWVFNGPGTYWTVPVALYDRKSPLVHVTQANDCGEGVPFAAVDLRIPAGVTGADPPVCYRDGMLSVINDDGYAYGFNMFRRTSDTTGLASYHTLNPYDHIITGSGFPFPGSGYKGNGHWISGANLVGGLIRKWETEKIAAGTMPYMRHALCGGLPDTLLRAANGGGQTATWRWPATFSDGGWTAYKGTVWMGSLLALDPSFDIEAQSWNEPSKVLARTLQKFGYY